MLYEAKQFLVEMKFPGENKIGSTTYNKETLIAEKKYYKNYSFYENIPLITYR